jgi:glycosyltransferase involved in cell wall biosynthesis
MVCPEPFSHRGGVSRIVERLLIGLPSQFEVSLACPGGRVDGLDSNAAGRLREVMDLPEEKWTRDSGRAFANSVASRSFDLLHFHDGGTFGYSLHIPWRSPLHCLPTNTPWIYSNHCVSDFGYFLSPQNNALKNVAMRVLAWLSKAWALQSCRTEVLDSRENENRLSAWFRPWSRRLRTIYHSGLTGRAPEPIFRERAVTIGNLGHIGRRKGQPDLFQAFGQLAGNHPGLRLVLMGDDGSGGDADTLRAAVRASGLASRVDIRPGASDTVAFWKDVDIYVQPSHFEGLPMALAEAMWHGKPSIATNVSGIPEILQHDANGLLCPPKSPDSLAHALDKLLRDPALRERLGRSAQETILQMGLTRENMCEAYANLYSEALSP